MAEQPEIDQSKTKRGPSITMLVIGFLALAVSAWAMVGPAELRDPTGGLSIGWTLVIGAIVVGVLLVLSPRKRR
ncbi:hypothetical protein [Nocardia sp. NPDC048505]|uniref:hypothetical protein n=1 Tax=unclassified Nocardia TaxID=2637762 RepID=UPI0033C058DF